MRRVKMDERILRDFKVGVFIGLRRSNQRMHSAFFINGKETNSADLAVIVDGVRALPGHLRKAYRDIRDSAAKEKKRKRRKKNPNSSP